jgi:hypothetical protein
VSTEALETSVLLRQMLLSSHSRAVTRRWDWRNAVYVGCNSSSERNVTARAFPSLLKLPRLVTIHVWPLRVILSPTTKIRSVSQNCVSPSGKQQRERARHRQTYLSAPPGAMAQAVVTAGGGAVVR